MKPHLIKEFLMKKITIMCLICLSLLLSPHAYGQTSVIINGCTIYNYMTPWTGGSYGDPKSAGWIMPMLTQNRVETYGANPIMTYTVSCPGDVTVSFLPEYTATQISQVDKFWRDVRPTQVSSKVNITVTPISNTSGPVLYGDYDVMNKRISGGGNYTYLGTPWQPAKLVVKMYIHPLYFYSNFYKENYQWELMDGTYFVSLRNNQGVIKGAVLYPNLFMEDEPCLIDAYETIVSTSIVDFGSVSKNEMEGGKVLTRSFNIDLTRKKGSCSGVTSTPKVTFIPQDNYDTNNIYLENGLMMTFKDENNRTIPMATSYNLGRVVNDRLKKTISVELKKGNKGKNIKSGLFSSTVVYLMEYY